MQANRPLVLTIAVALFSFGSLIPAAISWRRAIHIRAYEPPYRDHNFKLLERPLAFSSFALCVVHVVTDRLYAETTSTPPAIGVVALLSFRIVVVTFYIIMEMRSLDHINTLAAMNQAKSVPRWVFILYYVICGTAFLSAFVLPCINLIIDVNILYSVSWLIFAGQGFIVSIIGAISIWNMYRISLESFQRVHASLSNENRLENFAQLRRIKFLGFTHVTVAVFSAAVCGAFIAPLLSGTQYRVSKRHRVRFAVTPMFPYAIIVVGTVGILVDTWVPRSSVDSAIEAMHHRAHSAMNLDAVSASTTRTSTPASRMNELLSDARTMMIRVISKSEQDE